MSAMSHLGIGLGVRLAPRPVTGTSARLFFGLSHRHRGRVLEGSGYASTTILSTYTDA